MITYAFAARFVPLILSGDMTMVFTLPPDNPPAVGDSIGLIRRDDSTMIARATCVGSAPMEIMWTADDRIATIRDSGMPILRLGACARRMGYDDLADMANDFRRRFRLPLPRHGWATEWVIPEVALAGMEAA